jgi:hypothetical protein
MFELVFFFVGVWVIINVANFATCGITRRTIFQAIFVTIALGTLFVAVILNPLPPLA